MDGARWDAVLAALDPLLSLAIVSPLVVCYWRGCWQLMDLILFPGRPTASVFSSLVIGIVPALVFCLCQHQLETVLNARRRPCLYLLCSRLYTIVYSITCVNHWRGVWQIWDLYTGTSWQSGALAAVLGLLLLVVSRGVRNILAPPFCVCSDTPERYFTVPTLFKAQRGPARMRLLDALCTVVVTGSLVVFMWRGSWVVLDRVLYPRHPASSAVGSLVLGTLVTVLALLWQTPLARCAAALKGWRKILLEDVHNTFCFFATVNVWRGVWMTLNAFFLKEHPTLSNFVTAFGGQLLLTLMYCSNSLLVRGADQDGSLPGGNGIIHSASYLRHLCREHLKRRSITADYWVEGGSKQCNPALFDSFHKLNGGVRDARKLSEKDEVEQTKLDILKHSKLCAETDNMQDIERQSAQATKQESNLSKQDNGVQSTQNISKKLTDVSSEQNKNNIETENRGNKGEQSNDKSTTCEKQSKKCLPTVSKCDSAQTQTGVDNPPHASGTSSCQSGDNLTSNVINEDSKVPKMSNKDERAPSPTETAALISDISEQNNKGSKRSRPKAEPQAGDPAEICNEIEANNHLSAIETPL